MTILNDIKFANEHIAGAHILRGDYYENCNFLETLKLALCELGYNYSNVSGSEMLKLRDKFKYFYTNPNRHGRTISIYIKR
jgi:hypothetical protein